eukprot:CAMPEP_0202871766 /NCGR_PEP_ID=MMETSP1391-20130828/19603_1 /ASSEMBLY_ACC=CAM_ASM_000867 /TAXON_ID=1034604 /ORGANISM="Chlamydomonas leiostraca, Strain SAG 11-49" /LENGTH=231 /DNA_ID=CAMNT_0049552655 /DNA_START=432 /DNA_END=1127 /DNA_ORIENTATION=+
MPVRYTHLITTAMPARVTSTQNLPVNLKPATPEMYDQLAALATSATVSPTASTSATASHTGATDAPAGAGAQGQGQGQGQEQQQEQGEAPPPVHLFPEGGLTNGSGMMQFSRGFMKFVPRGTPVVPMALRARTPFGIRTHTLTSSFLSNLFWFSLCPWVEIEATVLPPQVQGEEEGRGEFVRRVQGLIAHELRVPVHDMTIQHKRAMMRAAEAQAKGSGKARAVSRARATA